MNIHIHVYPLTLEHTPHERVRSSPRKESERKREKSGKERERETSVLEHRSHVRTTWPHARIQRCVCMYIYVYIYVCVYSRVRVGSPRVNEYAAVAGWLVKTVALLAYPFLPRPPPSSSPSSSSRYPLTRRPPRDSHPPATLNRRPPRRLPLPLPLSPPAARPPRRPPPPPLLPSFSLPFRYSAPCESSSRVDVRLIRLKSRREATNYYASWSE